ncbi:MAG: LamG domain-containing protein [Candidatus Omnitrophota bacterium]
MRRLIVACIFALLMGCPTLGHAENYALDFDGVDDYVSAPDSNSLDLTSGLTIEAWINPREYANGANVIASKWYPSSYIFKLHNDGSGKLRIELSKGGFNDLANLKGNTAVSLDQWTHVATTFNGAETKLFVNGSFDGSQTQSGSIVPNSKPFYIGSVDGGEVFHGLIDEVRIWNYARSQQQLQDYMNGPLTGNEQGLMGYWNFDEGTGNTLGDLTQFGNDGQIYGARWVSSDSPVTTPVPEPTSLMLLSMGLLGAGVLKAKRRNFKKS